MSTEKLKVYFIGIGGIGVSALARYFLAFGNKVSGSDLFSSEITEALKDKGAKIFIGKHKILNIKSQALDLVIYSPAVQENNLELKWAKKSGIKCLSYPEALGELTKKYFTIAVAGSHGKSTVAAMIGLLLIKAKQDPTVILGTKLREFGDSNFRAGKSEYLVIEADEHFASFLNYWPMIVVLTTLEPDHLDYYKNFKNYLSAFKKFISHLPKNGRLVVNQDDKNVLKLAKSKKKETRFYSLKQKEAKKLRKILKIPGEFNVSNALATLTVARILQIPDKTSFKALSGYRGAWRRFDVKQATVNKKKITLINDYGHHPTQVKVTLEAIKEKYPRKKIWCIYQPHQYQRTYYLFKDFVKVFKDAPVDKLIITDIYDVVGRENKAIKKRVNSKKLVDAINKPNVLYLPKEKIINYLKKNLEGREVLVIMGAGDIYNFFKAKFL